MVHVLLSNVRVYSVSDVLRPIHAPQQLSDLMDIADHLAELTKSVIHNNFKLSIV